ncbi:FitA-like ribbon-helix-helix domain-containing protein [Novosphingobium pituita]|jgi:plasmid stability protein|uniref:Plasmid stabilization protein n=1 Tax=Novosphingobium pituita TaxID=3056842 RepID=A0ABQ6PC58_9SPHN|nr:plasmid stabilization protein [Novosphingobium sp. IK01]GMM62446.1 plasmid stabilization protein [Novosphingobium sp. IK01]
MPALTIRNIPEDVHRGLKALAASHGQSTEAEVRAILAAAVKPASRLKMGQALWELGREVGLTNDDIAAMEACRDSKPAEPLSFD